MYLPLWSVVSMAGLTVPMDLCKRNERVTVLHFYSDFTKIVIFFSITFILDMTDTEEKAVCDHITHKKKQQQAEAPSMVELVFGLLFPWGGFCCQNHREM